MPPYKPHPARAVINDFGIRLPEAVVETHITLFVCGPTPSRKSSALLRKYISTEIAKKIRAVTVVWGEHRDFRGLVGKNIHLRRFNDVTKELHFARNDSDLVIIFPDSPGSFVELGIFGMHPHVCSRLVIVFDKRYKKSKSFVIDAMGSTAKNQNAVIKFVNYKKRDQVLQQLEAIIRKKQESKYNSSSYA